MVAIHEMPLAREKHNTISSSSPVARAPAPLGASTAHRHMDAAVDVPEKDISASQTLLCDLWRGGESKKQGNERSQEVLRSLGAGEPFYMVSSARSHLGSAVL